MMNGDELAHEDGHLIVSSVLEQLSNLAHASLHYNITTNLQMSYYFILLPCMCVYIYAIINYIFLILYKAKAEFTFQSGDTLLSGIEESRITSRNGKPATKLIRQTHPSVITVMINRFA